MLSTFLIAGMWALLSFKFILPYYTQGYSKGHPIATRFHEFGTTPAEILVNILTSPSTWIKLVQEYLFGWDRVKYIVYLFAPFILFARKSWHWLIPAVPGILMNLISPLKQHRTMGFHYDLMVLPFIIFAFLMGIKQNNSYRKILICLGLALTFSGKWPTFYTKKYFPTWSDWQNSNYLKELDETKITVASMRTVSHINRIDSIRVFPDSFSTSSYSSFIEDMKNKYSKNSNRPIDASIWIFNNSVEMESQAKNLMLENGATLLSESPDKHFSILEFKYNP